MNIKHTLIKTGTAAGLGATLLVGLAGAQGEGTGTLADKLSQRFKLNKTEVQQVFDQHRDERRAEREKRYEERLSQAVKDGELTEEQKSKLLAKHKELVTEMEKNHEEMKSKRSEAQSMSEDERKKLRQQHRTS